MRWLHNLCILRNGYGSLRGYHRMRIREEVLRRGKWSPAALHTYSIAALRQRVEDGIRRFPQYAEKVRRHMGRLPDCNQLMDTTILPVWTKEDIRQWYEATPLAPVRGAWVHATGGTSGLPCRFYVTRESYEWRMAVSDRGYGWAGAEEGVPSVYVWGAPATRLSPVAQIRRGLTNRLQQRWFFNAMVLDAERCETCVNLINMIRPEVLVGYAGCLVTLADHIAAHPGILKHRARSIVTAAEGIDGNQVARVEAVFGGTVYRSYGSREFMLIGMECRNHQGYHVSSDNLWVEVVDEAGSPIMGKSGRILVTDLHNDATPFIRYETGDIGVMSPEPCSCGLPFPLLQKVEGRIQDVLTLPDGKTVSVLLLPHLLKEHRWVKAYQLQVVKGDPARWVLNVVTDGAETESMQTALIVELHRWVGKTVDISLRHVDRLVRAPNGKTPVVRWGE